MSDKVLLFKEIMHGKSWHQKIFDTKVNFSLEIF